MEKSQNVADMQKRLSTWKWVAIALVVTNICTAAFLYVRHNAAAKLEAESEESVTLNRSELDLLGEVEGTIYVTGHNNPDADTVGSSIAFAELLKALGYDARAVVLGDVNDETAYVLQKAGLETPELLTDASGLDMVLVDHSDYAQSADGLENATVHMIIDHHGVGSVTTGNQVIYDARPLGSTATIVWTLYHDYGITPDQKSAFALVGSILSDTHNLQPNSTTPTDTEALEDLCALAGIDDANAFYQEMLKASLSYSGMSDEEIFYSDYKDYEAAGTAFGIGCVEAYDDEEAKERAERMSKVLEEIKGTTDTPLLLAQVSVYHDGISISYLVPADEAMTEIIEAAYGDTATYDGTAFRLEPGVGRKKELVPAITKVLESSVQAAA